MPTRKETEIDAAMPEGRKLPSEVCVRGVMKCKKNNRTRRQLSMLWNPEQSP